MSLIDIGLDKTATVYTPDPTTGDWTVVNKTGLRVRLALTSVSGDMGPNRAEAAGARRLLWRPDYAMPADAQLEINGQRWNVIAGSLAEPTGLDGAEVYHRCEVIRAVE